ncbi:MAG TPA: pitrilysin family protein [Treponemataceae bacterium]|nr:pitrilysin family protein [Treponemataceae bacterium]
MPAIDRTLANNTRLVMEPVAASNSAAIGFWFPVGSRDEPDGFQGATHFIEHLLFKGTRTRTSRDIALFFDRAGGYINAFTEREVMCVMCVVPPDMAIPAVDLIIEMLYDSLLDPAEIATERDVILSEIMAVNDDPEENGMETALSLMYGNHPVARPIAGSLENIRTLPVETIHTWYRERIHAAAPLVTIAGNFDPVIIETRISAIPAPGGFQKGGGDQPPVLNGGFQAAPSPFRQSQLFLSWPLKDPRNAADWYAWAVINAITGDTVSSRLFQSLREKHGLCYSVYSFYVCNRDFSLWCSCLTTPPDKTLQALEKLVQELDRIVYNGFTGQEIADAKSHLAGDLRLSSDDTEYRMKRLARQILYNGQLLSIEESVNLILSLDSTMIHDRLKDSCAGIDKSLVLYGPKKTIREAGKRWK